MQIKETLTINSQDNNIINTNLKTNIVSDSDNSNTIFPNITNIEETMVILLDMNLFILHESSFSFNIYFLPVKNYIFFKKIKISCNCDILFKYSFIKRIRRKLQFK